MLLEELKQYYHGSYNLLKVGEILTPTRNGPWARSQFTKILERYRPPEYLSHYNTVFLVDNEKDVANAGGSSRYIFKVAPLGKVEKHDQYWKGRINYILEYQFKNDHNNPECINKLKEFSDNFWNGTPIPGIGLWEYFTPSAKILTVKNNW